MSKDVFTPERREAFHPAALSQMRDYAVTLVTGRSRDGEFTLDPGAREYLAAAELAWLRRGLCDTTARLEKWRGEREILRREIAACNQPSRPRAARPAGRNELESRLRRLERRLTRWERFQHLANDLRLDLGHWLRASTAPSLRPLSGDLAENRLAC